MCDSSATFEKPVMKRFQPDLILVCFSCIECNFCYSEMGVMPEIGQAVEEMDWRYVPLSFIVR